MKLFLLGVISIMMVSCGNPETYVVADNSQVDNLSKEIVDIRIRLMALETSDVEMQSHIEDVVERLVVLEMAESVISVIDPCPLIMSTMGYKEMLFEMSSGVIIGYFESGSKRFLTEIKRGVSYRTTDDRECIFTL